MNHPLTVFRERQKPPLTRAQLARLLGVSPASVTRWESGKRQPDKEMLPLIVERTGITPTELRPDLAELLRPSIPADTEQTTAPAQA